MQKPTYFLLACLLLTAVAVVAFSLTTNPFENVPSAAATNAPAQQGGAAHDFSDIIPVYGENCARCHGVAGQGQPGMPPLRGTALSDQQIAMMIRNGKGEMPAFPQLSDAQVERLISLIRHL